MREICLAGAASRGIAYIGAMRRLEEQGLLCDLARVVGVSIGALVGACVLMGYDALTMFRLVSDAETGRFLDPSLRGPSVLRGEAFGQWVGEVLGRRMPLGMTLGAFGRTSGDLEVLAVSLESGLEVLGPHTTPDMPVVVAVCASMAIPFVFPPVRYGDRTYVDGGILNNFPSGMVGSDGLGICVSHGNFGDPMGSPLGLLGSLARVVSEELRRFRPKGGAAVVTIPASDFLPIDFGMSLDDKVTLYMRGYEAVGGYVDSAITSDIGVRLFGG